MPGIFLTTNIFAHVGGFFCGEKTRFLQAALVSFAFCAAPILSDTSDKSDKSDSGAP